MKESGEGKAVSLSGLAPRNAYQLNSQAGKGSWALLRKTSVTRGRKDPGSFLVLAQSKRDGETFVTQYLA